MSVYSDLSIVIPYRKADPWRESLFKWTRARYRALMPAAEIVLGEMESDCPYFCRAEAINNGVRASHGTTILIADADVVCDPNALLYSRSMLRGGEFARYLPYDNYLHLTKRSTQRLLASPPEDQIHGRQVEVDAAYPNSTSGLCLIDRAVFWESGGFDERFQGWGPEDQAWDAAIETLCGPTGRVTGWHLYHLWHPIARGHRTDNPFYPESMALFERYREAAGDPERMRVLLVTPHCPHCGRLCEPAGDDWQCHVCGRLWPESWFETA